MLCEAFRAMRNHDIDFTTLPGYRAKASGTKETLRWTERLCREISTEVHRYEVGIAVLVASSPAPDPEAARRAAAQRRGRKRPPQPPRLVYSNPSPSSSPPEWDEWE
jgi:hypothetical protein